MQFKQIVERAIHWFSSIEVEQERIESDFPLSMGQFAKDHAVDKAEQTWLETLPDEERQKVSDYMSGPEESNSEVDHSLQSPKSDITVQNLEVQQTN